MNRAVQYLMGRRCASEGIASRWFTLLTLLLACGVPLTASADRIRLRNGRSFSGTILQRTPAAVVVQLDIGTMSFTPDEIAVVETEESAARVALPVPPASPSLAIPINRHDGEQAVVSQPIAEEDRQPPALEDAMKAVAYIGVAYPDGRLGLGSGTIINATGTMITNYHVIEGAVAVAAIIPELKGSQAHEAKVLKTDPCLDLALINLPVKTPHYLRFAEEGGMRVGQAVTAIGNPEGLAASVSRGVVSAIRTMKDLVGDLSAVSIPGCDHLSSRTLEAFTLVQTTAAINPGNSGGPLINDRHEIVGINSYAILGTGLNFAIHAKHARKMAGGYLKKE